MAEKNHQQHFAVGSVPEPAFSAGHDSAAPPRDQAAILPHRVNPHGRGERGAGPAHRTPQAPAADSPDSTLQREIAARQAAEAALREREAHLSGLVENFRLGILVHRHYQPIYANIAFSESLGFGSPDEFMRAAAENPPAFYVHADDREGAISRHEARLAGATDLPSPVEWRAVRLDGTVVWFESTHRIVDWEGGPAMQSTQVDITERKRNDEELRRSNAALEAVNNELEAFAYSVSHDLRQPLRSMTGFGEILLEDYGDKLDAQGQDYIRRIQAAARRMGRLIDDLLALSRITRGELNTERVDLTALATRILGDERQSQPEREVEVRIEPGMEADGDPRLLELLLINLLTNAWKFTGRRTDARIEMGSALERGERVYFVRDNGAGFDMAYADKLFAPFQRLHGVEEFPGTGVGLAIVQRIVHRHGGRVQAEAAKGLGATFRFTLG